MSSNQAKNHVIVKVNHPKPLSLKNRSLQNKGEQTVSHRIEFWFEEGSEMHKRMINSNRVQVVYHGI